MSATCDKTSKTSDIIAAMALVVSVLTFGITSWLNYHINEWKKVMEEVTLSSTYDEAQEAATELYRLNEALNALQVSKARSEERYRGLDYADILFLYERGLLRDADIEPLCREIEAHRRKAQKAWDVIIGKYDSYQVMHHHNAFVRGLRWLVGLPNQTFFSNKWVGRGKRHMDLVEPLDVANWYIVNNENTGYCDHHEEIRPRRYVMLQQEIQRPCNHVFNPTINQENRIESWIEKYQRELNDRATRYKEVVAEQLGVTNAPGQVPESLKAGGGVKKKFDVDVVISGPPKEK